MTTKVTMGTKAAVGDRVACVLRSDVTRVELIGFGVYVGNELPPDEIGDIVELVKELGGTNPRINLDRGGYVFGCECWWGPEAEFLEWANGREVVEVGMHREAI